MVAARKKIDDEHISVGYDRPVDVLYIVRGGPVASEGEGLPYGIELDFATRTGEPCGVTVLGYRRNGWSGRLTELAKIASRHLKVDPAELAKLIRTKAGVD